MRPTITTVYILHWRGSLTRRICWLIMMLQLLMDQVCLWTIWVDSHQFENFERTTECPIGHSYWRCHFFEPPYRIEKFFGTKFLLIIIANLTMGINGAADTLLRYDSNRWQHCCVGLYRRRLKRWHYLSGCTVVGIRSRRCPFHLDRLTYFFFQYILMSTVWLFHEQYLGHRCS